MSDHQEEIHHQIRLMTRSGIDDASDAAAELEARLAETRFLLDQSMVREALLRQQIKEMRSSLTWRLGAPARRAVRSEIEGLRKAVRLARRVRDRARTMKGIVAKGAAR